MALDSFDFQYFGFNHSPPWFGLRHLIVVPLLFRYHKKPIFSIPVDEIRPMKIKRAASFETLYFCICEHKDTSQLVR